MKFTAALFALASATNSTGDWCKEESFHCHCGGSVTFKQVSLLPLA
jgi:hypothetical protein